MPPCAAPCAISAWGAWGACAKTCGIGTRSRWRTVCDLGRQRQKTACDQGPCPWHCEVSAWSSWDRCSRTCGGGLRFRSRDIVFKRKPAVCPRVHDTAPCSAAPCPRSCLVSAWGGWGACTALNAADSQGGKPCGGGGRRTRTRSVLRKSSAGGACRLRLLQTRRCGGKCHCVVSAWGAWSACDKTCGTHATQTRARRVVKRFQVCSAVLTQRRACKDEVCATRNPIVAACAAHGGCAACAADARCGWCTSAAGAGAGGGRAAGACQFVSLQCTRWAQACPSAARRRRAQLTAAPGCPCTQAPQPIQAKKGFDFGARCARWQGKDMHPWCYVEAGCHKLYDGVGAAGFRVHANTHGWGRGKTAPAYWKRCLPRAEGAAAVAAPPVRARPPHAAAAAPAPVTLASLQKEAAALRRTAALRHKIAALKAAISRAKKSKRFRPAKLAPSAPPPPPSAPPPAAAAAAAAATITPYLPAGCACAGESDELGQGGRCARWGDDPVPWCYAAATAPGATCPLALTPVSASRCPWLGRAGGRVPCYLLHCGSGRYLVLDAPGAGGTMKPLWVEYARPGQRGTSAASGGTGDGWVRVYAQRANTDAHATANDRFVLEDTGAAFANALFARSRTRLLRYDVDGAPYCVYKRTAPGAFDVHGLMAGAWPAARSARLHRDFELYGTNAQAQADLQPWDTCPHHRQGGFPGDCGYRAAVHDMWALSGADAIQYPGMRTGKKTWAFFIHAPEAVAAAVVGAVH